MKSIAKLSPLVGTLVGVLLFFGAAPALAKGPACWKTLINDWYDGRIDNVYPVSCYQDALKHLPEDVQTYSSARDDIKAALASRLLNKGKKNSGHQTVVPAGPGKGDGGPKNGGGTKGRTPPGGPLNKAIGSGSTGASSVPIPLIVLAGIAGLLLAAGAAGFAARRIQARRAPLQTRPPAPQSDPRR